MALKKTFSVFLLFLFGFYSETSKSQYCGCSPILCCSKSGFCGITDDYCGSGCKSGPCRKSAIVVPSDTDQDYVTAHNQARSQVGVGPMKWDEVVAAYARGFADQLKGDCRLKRSGGPYGENTAMSSGDLSHATAVKLWVDEKANYNYEMNTCNGVCGHYTQVVWTKSVRLGSAEVRCNNGGTIIICNYDPPGNYVNQKPY